MTQEEFNQLQKDGKVKAVAKPTEAKKVTPRDTTLDLYIAVLEAMRKPRIYLDSAPTFVPKNFADQIQFVDDGVNKTVYVYINGEWVQLGGGQLPNYTAPEGEDINLTGGPKGGGVFLTGGDPDTDGDGADIGINASWGDGTGKGGDVRQTAGGGGATNGNGGDFEQAAGQGTGTGTGGDYITEAGQGGGSNGYGGNWVAKSGAGHGIGDAGHIILEAARSTGGAGLDGSVVIGQSRVPTSASDTGVQGAIAYDSSYIYVCIMANTWKRVAISTW